MWAAHQKGNAPPRTLPVRDVDHRRGVIELVNARIGEDARFDAKLTKSLIAGDPWYPKRIIYYFCTHLLLSFQPTFCIDISGQMEKKMAAIAAYESQFGWNKSKVPEMVRTLNGYFGGRIGTAYAEPFFTHEVLGLSGLGEVI